MPIAHIDLFPNALFSLFTLSLRGTSPPNLPFTKGRNVLSFSFTTIEFSLDISFRVAMQHTSPLEKGRKREDYLYRTDYILKVKGDVTVKSCCKIDKKCVFSSK